MLVRCRAVMLFALMPLLLGSGAVLCAQVPEGAADSDSEGAAPQKRPAGEGDVIYRPGPDDQWEAVPVTEHSLPTLEDFLGPAADRNPPVPDYFVYQLTLDGRVVESWAQITADVKVQVVTDDRWLRVPLRFDQALLLSYTHQGAGEAAPSTTEESNEGLTWMLRGKGVHTLSLTLRVPLRQTANGSQLQLFVPELSKQFAGQFQLRLPGQQLAIQSGEDLHFLGEPRQAGEETIVSATLAGDRVDVRWHPIVQDANPISQVLTHLTLRLRGQRVLLSAGQELWLRQSGPAAVEVRLPSGVELSDVAVRISDTSGAERPVRPVPIEGDGWVSVPLEGVIGTAVHLDWSIDMPFDGSLSQLIVDGLEVAGAAEQSGTIALEGFDRHVLTRQVNSGGGVSRIGVDELPAAGTFANLAYRFQTGNYQLVLDVDPLESTFRITPVYWLDLSEFRTEFTAWFLVSLDEGQLDAVPLKWPKFSEQHWDVEPLAADGGEVRRDDVSEQQAKDDHPAEEVPENTRESPSTRWLLKPARPLENGGEIGLSATWAHLLEEGSGPTEIVLPQAAEGRMLPGVLYVTMSDNIQATIDSGPGIVLTPRTRFPRVPVSLLEDLENRPQLSYELVIEDPTAPLVLNVSRSIHPLQVRTSSVVTVEEVDTNPRVTQAIDYDVSFGRLSSVRLSVPALLDEFLSDARNEALPFSVGGEVLPATSVTWDGAEVELQLSAAMRGPFQITIGPYTTPALQGYVTRLEVPIISSLDRTYDSLRVVIPNLETTAVTIADNLWTQLQTIVEGAEWITQSSVESVTLDLDQQLDAVPQQMTIPLATIRSNISESGVVRTEAQYLLDSECSQIVVQLPENAEHHEFSWSGRSIGAPLLLELPEVPHQFRVERPADDLSRTSWLHVSYTIRNKPLGWTQRSSLPFPRFGNGVTIERTQWEVKLPRAQHLLTRPKDLSQLYSWSRIGLIWSRSPEPSYRQSRAQLTSQGADEVFPIDAGNVYPFETFGTLNEVSVRSMSNSLLVFLGAGLTLVASFLVIKVEVARSLWFWLVGGAVVAFLSLWHLEAILLLLQPAAYGLLLPIGAALFEFLTDRKTGAPESLSTRRSFDLALPQADDSRPSAGSGSGYDPTIPSTLVRPTALSDSGRR